MKAIIRLTVLFKSISAMSSTPYCQLHQNAFSAKTCREITTQISASGLLGRSQLDSMFKESQGFGIAFTSAHLSQILASHPFFSPFLNHVLRKNAFAPVFAQRQKRSFFSRKEKNAPLISTANAWYANVLLIEKGAGVGAHFDGTLGHLLSETGLMPTLVSVLYLEVPERSDEGNYEMLSLTGRVLKKISPQVGAIVEFDGRARHRVCPSQQRRMSMVVEQYALSDAHFAKMHEPRFQTRAMDPAFRSPKAPPSFSEVMRKRSAPAKK